MQPWSCPACGEIIPAEQINIQAGIAICPSCSAVSNFSSCLDGEKEKPKKKKNELPRTFRVQETPDGYMIAFHTRSSFAGFMGCFAILWSLPTVPLFVLAWSLNNMIAALSLLPFAGIGVFLLYWAATMLVNTTRITISWDAIRVRQMPIPTLNNRDYDRLDIDQLYCKRQTVYVNGIPQHQYQVRFKFQDGTDHALVSDVPTYEQALFLERQIERYLKIKDEFVEGEYRA